MFVAEIFLHQVYIFFLDYSQKNGRQVRLEEFTVTDQSVVVAVKAVEYTGDNAESLLGKDSTLP